MSNKLANLRIELVLAEKRHAATIRRYQAACDAWERADEGTRKAISLNSIIDEIEIGIRAIATAQAKFNAAKPRPHREA